MSVVLSIPPAPWVNRDLPRAPLRLTRRSLRVARGSLLLTTGTGYRRAITLDQNHKHSDQQMHPTVPPRTRAPWSSSIGIDGRHASEPVVFFVGMPTSARNQAKGSGDGVIGGPARHQKSIWFVADKQAGEVGRLPPTSFRSARLECQNQSGNRI
jgi:hypothetical protein